MAARLIRRAARSRINKQRSKKPGRRSSAQVRRQRPVLVRTIVNRRPNVAPKMSTKKGVVVSHTELLGTYTIPAGAWSVVGKTNGYALNAGSRYSFPWLAGIARHFEKYRFMNVEFSIKTSSPTIYGGRLYLAVDPDTTDAPPTSAAQMMSYPYVASSVVYQTCSLKLNSATCAALHKPFSEAFIKEQDGADTYPRSSTVGRVYMGAALDQSITVDLFCSYTVQLLQPQIIVGEVSAEYGRMDPGALAASKTFMPPLTNFTPSVPSILGTALREGVSQAAVLLDRIRSDMFTVTAGVADNSGARPVGTMVPGPTDVGFSVVDAKGEELADVIAGGPYVIASNYAQPILDAGHYSYSDARELLVDKRSILRAFPTATALIPWVVSLVTVASARLSMQVKTEL